MKPLKPYEKESLLKTFLIFFVLLELLLALFFWQLYRNEKHKMHRDLLQQMQLCSYTIKCETFTFDFVPKGGNKTNTLFIKDDEAYGYFPIPESEKFALLITYPKEHYREKIRLIVDSLIWRFLGASLVLMVLSLFFTYYTLRPLRKALFTNDEFVKDILHDYNTPITAMKLSIAMYKRKKGDDTNIQRIAQAIETLNSLQENLKSFLKCSPGTMQMVDVAAIAQKRVNLMQNIYPSIQFRTRLDTKMKRLTHPELLQRIIDNLLSNAAKYSGKDSIVDVYIENESLVIRDNGIGISDVQAVLQRYGTENKRGIGLGLHIVQKLCDELGILFKLESSQGEGTTAILDFRHLSKERS